jgi:hypothetical protein
MLDGKSSPAVKSFANIVSSFKVCGEGCSFTP